MFYDIIRAGRWRYAPREPCYPEPLEIPEGHPCEGCPVLSREAGIPYCFLPKCRRELFLTEEGDPIHEENHKAAGPGFTI